MALAPWEAPASTDSSAAPAASTAAPWEVAPKRPLTTAEMASNVHPIDDTINYIKDYGRGLGNAAAELAIQGGKTDFLGGLKADAQAAASIATGVGSAITTPFRYAADRLTGGNASFSQLMSEGTYHPDGLGGAVVNALGAVTKPVGDVFHGIAKGFTDDPEIQAQIEDGLQVASLGVAAGPKGSLVKTDIPAAEAPSIITHPAVQAANDLANRYGIKLTKGQQVAQAAADLPPSETPTARALNVPYQLEAKTAQQTGAAGKAYADHFATQQNTLASHVQDVADAVRAAGDDDTAMKIENTILTKTPGVNTVSGARLQRVVDKNLVDDPDLASKLNELNDLSGVIDPPPRGPIAPATVVSKIKDNLGAGSIGAAAGGALGFKVGNIVGHPMIGAELGATAGGSVGAAVGNLFGGGSTLDTSALSTSDIATLAKQSGLTPVQMADQLARQAPASVAPRPVSTPSNPTGQAPIAAPPASPAVASPAPVTPTPVPAAPVAPVAAPAPVAPVAAPAPVITAANFPPELLDKAAWTRYLQSNPVTDSAGWAARSKLTEAREDALRAAGKNPRAINPADQPDTITQSRISNYSQGMTAADKAINYVQHKLRMESDPEYRAAQLLKAGIIENRDPASLDLLRSGIIEDR